MKISKIDTSPKDVLALVSGSSVTINLGENGLTATIEGGNRTVVIADNKQLERYLSLAPASGGKSVVKSETK